MEAWAQYEDLKKQSPLLEEARARQLEEMRVKLEEKSSSSMKELSVNYKWRLRLLEVQSDQDHALVKKLFEGQNNMKCEIRSLKGENEALVAKVQHDCYKHRG